MERGTARRIVVVSIVLGLLAVRLCYDLPTGLNAPVLTILVLVGAVLTRPAGARFDPLDAWLPAAALAVTLGAALRADPALQFIDLGLALALVGASVPAIAGYAITRSTALVLSGIGVRVMTSVAIAGAPILVAAAPTPDGTAFASGRKALAPYVRGLLIALPIVVLFVGLFAGADAVFAQVARDALHPDLELGDLPTRGSLTIAVAWLAAGLFAMWASILPTVESGPIEDWPAPAWVPPADLPRTAATTEAFVVLAAVDAIFALFVGLQVAYLFGGHDTLAVAGMTYSEYARRGFFELVIVAVLAVGLVVLIDRVVGRRSRGVVGASLVLLAFTAVVLVSALFRLRLYQDAYGWTELRFYVLTTIFFLAFALVVTAVLLLRDRIAWLGHALAMGGVAVVVALAAIGPVGFIADRNLERALHPELVPAGGRTGIDAAYVASLGDDAIPALVAAYGKLPPADDRLVGQALQRRWDVLRDFPPDGDPAAWNLGRARARAALLARFGP
jgi:uncharacterized protein DUF4153